MMFMFFALQIPPHPDTALQQLKSENLKPEVKEDESAKVVDEQNGTGDCLPNEEVSAPCEVNDSYLQG